MLQFGGVREPNLPNPRREILVGIIVLFLEAESLKPLGYCRCLSVSFLWRQIILLIRDLTFRLNGRNFRSRATGCRRNTILRTGEGLS